MKFKFEKDMHIMVDIVSWCRKLGADSFHIDIENDETGFWLKIRCKIDMLGETPLNELKSELNRSRQKEIEQDYWGLMGEIETDCELTLVGMMVDEANIGYIDDILSIEVFRSEKSV